MPEFILHFQTNPTAPPASISPIEIHDIIPAGSLTLAVSAPA
jgi:hypothetical protein